MIEKLTVRNYKSVRSVEVPLQPLTVFVGPNASGKSNLLDSLAFLKSVVAGASPRDALATRHKYESVEWGGNPGEHISLGIAGAQEDEAGRKNTFCYSCEFSGEKKGQIVMETLESSSTPLPEKVGERQFKVGKSESIELSPDQSLFLYFRGDSRFPFLGQLARFIESWEFYHFSPREMREPGPVQEQAVLAATGQNLNTVLHYLFSERGDAFREVEETVQAFLPDVQELRSRLTGSNTYAAFLERGLPKPIATWQMSDGSLFCLALATALLTPQPPGLLAIEAPDTELHPYVMEQVAGALQAASRRTQVLVTTHSPFLLRHLPPECLVIVEKKNGETSCTPVMDRAGAREAIKLLGVEEAFYSGHLGGVP